MIKRVWLLWRLYRILWNNAFQFFCVFGSWFSVFFYAVFVSLFQLLFSKPKEHLLFCIAFTVANEFKINKWNPMFVLFSNICYTNNKEFHESSSHLKWCELIRKIVQNSFDDPHERSKNNYFVCADGIFVVIWVINQCNIAVCNRYEYNRCIVFGYSFDVNGTIKSRKRHALWPVVTGESENLSFRFVV